MCTVCKSGEVSDEFHYLLNCSNENAETVKETILLIIKFMTVLLILCRQIDIIPMWPHFVAL